MLYKAIRETLISKPTLIPAQDGFATGNSTKDWYSSLFYYTEEHKKQYESTGTLKGIEDTITDRLYFDFDSKDNLDLAFDDAKHLTLKLVEKFNFPWETINLYYTGKKGFSVEALVNISMTNKEFKSVVFTLASEYKTFDKVVNDPNRIVRLPNTRHQDSGLYKIPLMFEEVEDLTIPKILEMAKAPRNVKVNVARASLDVKQFVKVEEKKIVNVVQLDDIDFTRKVKSWSNCKWALSQGYDVKSGSRHEKLLCLVATSRALNYTKEQAYYNAKNADEQGVVRNGGTKANKEDVWTMVESVYDESWKGGQYSCKDGKTPWLTELCNTLGSHKCKHDIDKAPEKISDIEAQFKHFVLNIDKNTIKTGLEELDKRMPLTIGMNLGVVGAPSTGKTALALEILKNTSKAGIVSVFGSLDMHRNRLFEKLLYKASGGKSREHIYDLFKNNQEKELLDKIKEDYGNVYFYDRSSPTVADIRAYIENINETNPKQVKLVMLDYFERVTSERSDDTAASKDVAGKLQDLLNDFSVCLITLVQPNKHSLGNDGPSTPLLSYTAIKGSSYVSQAFRSVISMWRPFLNPNTPEKDKYIQFAILKNDLGELGTINYRFEGKTGSIKPLQPEEEFELKQWLKEKEDKKQDTGGMDY